MKKSRQSQMMESISRDLVLQPDVSVLVKLGSIAIHADEMLSPDGHHFDRAALQSLLNDVEIRDWLKEMAKMALIPEKRK